MTHIESHVEKGEALDRRNMLPCSLLDSRESEVSVENQGIGQHWISF